jgi:D-alanyl-D-alanine carboxypeptidase
MKVKASCFLLLILVSSFLISCGEKSDVTTDKKDSSGSTTETRKQFASEMTTKFDSILNAAMMNDSIPSVTGGIWIPSMGEYTFAKGVSDRETQTPRKMTDHFRIGSVTKTFTATVILMLCDEGKIALNDKLDKYFPETPNAKEITIRMLLDMTSGLGDYLQAKEIDEKLSESMTVKFTDEELYNIAIKQPVEFSPGEEGKWRYSNTNYLLLGMIIEKVTGNEWYQEVTTRIIDKLGMKNTLCPTTPDIPEPYAHGYIKDSTGKVLDATQIDPSITGAAGAMISNIPDLVIWANALTEGTLLSDTMQAERVKFVQTFITDKVSYGLGILNVDGFWGHNGGIPGFNTSMYKSPEKDALFIISVNMYLDKGASDKIYTELVKAVYPDNEGFPISQHRQ